MTDEQGLEFVDTNIIVYAYDSSSLKKQKRASDLLLKLWENHKGCISVQVLQEFYVSVTKKVTSPLKIPETIEIMEDLSCWNLHKPEAADVIEAVRIGQRNQISFWDAMIISSAKNMRCNILWTEDLNDGQFIEGVILKNPF